MEELNPTLTVTDYLNITSSKGKPKEPLLSRLIRSEEQLIKQSSKDIVVPPPIIELNEVPIIRKGTINIIQGKYGSHKSRLAEMFCSLLLSKKENIELLGFKRKIKEKITVCYIDTERNIVEEFPIAIQSVKENANFNKYEQVSNFRFTSVKQIERKLRLNAVETFLENVRQSTTDLLFVVLDVVTDCISDFNNAEESMKLLDYLGNLCEIYNVTLLIIIHENPFNDKARGHIGTEGANKSSTVMSIGYEKSKGGEESNIIRLKFLKTRSSKRPPNIQLVYDDEKNGLVVVNTNVFENSKLVKKEKASVEEIQSYIQEFMIDKRDYPQKELIGYLEQKLNCSISPNTIKVRLKEIEESKVTIINAEKIACNLVVNSINGKKTTYQLVPYN